MAVETQQFLRLENARIVTGENSKVIESGSIVICDDRIAWVGDAREIPKEFQFADQIVDLDRRTVIPGLVDTHMHISFGEAQSEEELSIHTPMAYRAIRASADAQKVIRAGVTSACDPGGPIGIATAVRDAIDAGLVVGPRMAAAGRQITTQLGVGDTLPEPLGDLSTSFGALVRSKNEIVQEIRNEIKAGVDLIKLAGSGPGTEEFGAFDFEELCVAVAEAHRLGKPIAIHARSRQSIADAVNANFDWIMHASFMDDRTLEELVAKQIPIIPAMTLLVNSIECGQGVLPPKILDGIKRELDSAVMVLSKAHRAGAILIAGSESGFAMTPYGEWHTREMELFVELLGFSNFDALLSMTKVASLAIPRFGNLIGTLSQGKYADLVVVDGRPDEDVKLLGRKKNLFAVMKGGNFIGISHAELARETYLFERTRLYTNGKFRRNDS